MVNFCLLMAPILLLWRQWGIAFGRWSNILIVYYIWFSAGTNLWSIQDEYIACVYFQFKAPSGYYVYCVLFSIVLLWTVAVYGITYWDAAHTYWRHFIYNVLVAFNIQAYDYYPANYEKDLFKRWFKRQKRFKIVNSIISHHFIFYLLCYEFVDFYNFASPVDWYAVSQLFDKYFYVWCLSFYCITLFRSIFVSNFLISHMYFFYNNLFFEGISDMHYFINDKSYSTRLRREIMPMSKSGFRQVSLEYNSLRRMFRVKRYYLLDRNLEHGRFFMPVSWINFKYETYDLISISKFYKVKSRFQHFWFRAVINMSYVKRVGWRKTFYLRKRKRYKSNFYLKKELGKRKIMFNISFFFNNARSNRSIIISKKFLFIFKFKPLQIRLQRRNGKSSLGSYTIFSKGSSKFNKYNIVDYRRTNISLPALLVGNNFDNFRFCFLGLLKFLNGSFSYILLPHRLNLGYLVVTTNQTFKFLSSLGFCRPLYSINHKQRIFNISYGSGLGGFYSRAAGTSAQLVRHTNNGVIIKLPSGQTKLFPEYALATIGRASNVNKNTEVVKNFGFKRKLGWKSVVRGEAKNPCDHPHGGTTKGGKPKMNPWGKVFK